MAGDPQRAGTLDRSAVGAAPDLGHVSARHQSLARLGPYRVDEGGADDGGRGVPGWACPGDAFDILGGRWPPTAVSHTGFTGTSLALDPVSGVWVVLLTNAVHAGRDATAVKALRRAVQEAVRVRASIPP